MFSQNESLLPSTFPQGGRNSSTSPAVTLFAAPPSAPQTGVGRDGEGRGGEGGDKTGQGPLVWRSLPLHY